MLVNDGSPDHSGAVCRALHVRYPDVVVYVRASEELGEHNAVMAGLHHATGAYVVIMDDDFQNPPEEVGRLVAPPPPPPPPPRPAHDYDVVLHPLRAEASPLVPQPGSRFNDRVANLMLGKPRGLYLSSFKCLNRFTADQVLRYGGPYPYVDGLILRCTRRIGTLQVRHDPRKVGRSNYTLGKLLSLWLNTFVNFSVLPLRLSAALGFASCLAGVLLGLVTVVERVLRPGTPVGWASLMVALLTFSGVQLVMMGVVGEYVGRIFLSGNQTPQFVVRAVVEGAALPCTTPSRSISSVEGGCLSPEAWVSSAATSPSVSSLSGLG
ncbi:MAG: glycosyltransferase [Isosphaeraceae bacterium]